MTSISDTEVVNAPGGLVELGYAERTSNITSISTSATSPTTVAETTIVSDGSPLVIDFFASHARPNTSAGSSINISLWVDGAEYTRYWTYTETPSTANLWAPIRATRRITLAAGSHTIRAVVWSNNSGALLYADAGGSTQTAPAFLRVSKILQASQLLVTQSNAPIVTSLPSGNLVTGQEVYLYTVYGYVRYLWDGSNWIVTADNRKVFFTARGTSYQGAANGFYNFIFNTTDQNLGNAYNTANGAFTAPIAGFYFFGLNVRLDSTPAGGYLRAYVYRNGTTVWEAPNLHAIFGNNHATDYHTLSVSGLMYLTEGQVVYSGGGHVSGSSNLLRSESTFTGYLVK